MFLMQRSDGIRTTGIAHIDERRATIVSALSIAIVRPIAAGSIG
jgi:hypothetical protein